METIVIYPGRFQPFGKHHGEAYRFLASMFGPQHVYVTTSDHIELPDSPFSFNEKIEFIKHYVPFHMIKKCKNLYKATEILEQYDLSNTRVIFAYSNKDAGRISYTKEDGSPGYFVPYDPHNSVQYTADQHGYILLIPEFSIKFHGRSISGTYMRQLLTNMAKKDPMSSNNQMEFRRLFGFFDRGLYAKTMAKFK